MTLALIYIGTLITIEGLRHIEPVSTFRKSYQSATKGQVTKSASLATQAIWMTVEAGSRWSIVKTFYSPNLLSLERNGKLSEALKMCTDIVKLLSLYDDEGSFGYRCSVIEETIQRQQPTAAP